MAINDSECGGVVRLMSAAGAEDVVAGIRKDIFASAPQRQPVTNKFVHEIIKDIPNGIPTIGNPDLYPLDYYAIGFKWSLIAPTSWRLVDYNTHIVAPLAFYGFVRGDDSGPGLAAQVIGTSGQNRAVLHLHGRNGVERAFILVIGAIPFVFAFVFLHLLFINRRTRGGSLNDFIVALAAAVLAILPLHAVLVPSGLDGLTLLDLWLGLGAGVLVCVTLGKYFTDVMADIRPKRPRASLKQGDVRAPGHRPEAGGVSVAAAPAVDPGG